MLVIFKYKNREEGLVFQQPHPQHFFFFERSCTKGASSGGLFSSGRGLPICVISSSKRKHCRIVSEAKENTLMKTEPTK